MSDRLHACADCGAPTDGGWCSACLDETAPGPATTTQIGGDHYKRFAIQPAEFIQRNGIGWCEGNAIKYVCRWREKNGRQDLEKARHYIDLLLEIEG